MLIDSKAYKKENERTEQINTQDVGMPEEYTDTKCSMLEVIKNASQNASAISQKEELARILSYMEKKLINEKNSIEH